jgi:hypothetical protein
MISTVILSAVATNQGLQQNTSEDGFEHMNIAREKRAGGNIDGQPTVGPIQRVPARLPAMNGESWTSVILVHC